MPWKNKEKLEARIEVLRNANDLHLYTDADVAWHLGNIKIERLHKMIAEGRFPSGIDVDGTPMWRRKDLKHWINMQAALAIRVTYDCNLNRFKYSRPAAPGDIPEELEELTGMLVEYASYPPCVYFLINFGTIVYIGQTKDLPSRLLAHKRGSEATPRKDFNRVLFLVVPEEKLVEVESYYIKLLEPLYNGSKKPTVPASSAE